jgi:GH3 auxin-responsive promoter
VSGASILARPLAWLADRRLRRLEATWREPLAVQERALRAMIIRARDTVWGREHGFAEIRGIADYLRRVPITSYPGLRPLVERGIGGEADVLWPGRPAQYCKTSGTTAGDKYIPLTREAFQGHRQGGLDTLLVALRRVGRAERLDGPLLFLGGSSQTERLGRHAEVGDLSGLAARRIPRWLRGRYTPGPAIAAIPDWEHRLTATARLVRHQDVRLISGMPSWMLVLFEHVARERQASDRALRELGALWPNLNVFVHGGVSFAPYRGVFEEWMGRALEYVEVYPASEGFVGLQTERAGGLTLMLDYGIFYEFVPVEDLGESHPRRHTVADVEVGRLYAVALTTPAGLWSYLLGDTVRFTARDPLRMVIAGRTRHYVNAFGENVIVEEVERALLAACGATGAEVGEFTVAPRFPSADEPRGGHDWLVEFRVAPRDRDGFVARLDAQLAMLNTDYRIKRRASVGMLPPRLVEVARGGFHRWLAARGKLGDQHKVPRVTNTRELADELLAHAAGPAAVAGAVAM